MAGSGPGYPEDMGDRERTKQPVEDVRPVDVDAVPDEEDIDIADVAEELVEEPSEHLNRPDQPDFDPAEREQYDEPIAEPELHEDR
jgi:hypothetical protein